MLDFDKRASTFTLALVVTVNILIKLRIKYMLGFQHSISFSYYILYNYFYFCSLKYRSLINDVCHTVWWSPNNTKRLPIYLKPVVLGKMVCRKLLWVFIQYELSLQCILSQNPHTEDGFDYNAFIIFNIIDVNFETSCTIVTRVMLYVMLSEFSKSNVVLDSIRYYCSFNFSSNHWRHRAQAPPKDLKVEIEQIPFRLLENQP